MHGCFSFVVIILHSPTGRGKPYQNHPGNLRLHQVVQFHKARYAKAKRQDKVAIAEEVLRMVQDAPTTGMQPQSAFSSGEQQRQEQQPSQGARFLRRAVTDEGEQYWTVVKHSVALDKVGHALRGKGTPKSSPAAVQEAKSVEIGVGGIGNHRPPLSTSTLAVLREESKTTQPTFLPLYHPESSSAQHQQQSSSTSSPSSSRWFPSENQARQRFINQISQLNTDTLATIVQQFCGGNAATTSSLQQQQAQQQQQQQLLLQQQQQLLQLLPTATPNIIAQQVIPQGLLRQDGTINVASPSSAVDPSSSLNAALAALSATQQQSQQQQIQSPSQQPQVQPLPTPQPSQIPSTQNVGVDQSGANTQLLANFLLQQGQRVAATTQQQQLPQQSAIPQQQQPQQLQLLQNSPQQAQQLDASSQYLQLLAAMQMQQQNNSNNAGSGNTGT